MSIKDRQHPLILNLYFKIYLEFENRVKSKVVELYEVYITLLIGNGSSRTRIYRVTSVGYLRTRLCKVITKKDLKLQK